MPWKVEKMENLKQKFILLHQTRQFTMVELCKQFGISRPTGYAILERYRTEGWDALQERSRSHSHHANQTDERIEKELIGLRDKHPRWGARKLIVLLQREQPSWSIPCESTVNNILKRNGRVTPRKKSRRKIVNTYPQFDPTGPNEIWSADFKGKFRLGNRVYCNPLTIADSYSRFLFDIRALEYCRAEECKPVFDRVFREYGLPEQLHTDNGPPFGSPISLRRLTNFAVWLIEIGITPVYSDPGQPQQNGRHERMHRDLKAQATRPPASGFISQQRRFDRFREEYNEIRPHEGLQMRTPSEVHEVSKRSYSGRIEEWAYATTLKLKMVTANGALRWNSDGFIMVSTALSGKYVGLEEIDTGVWIVYYRHVALGVLSERARRVYELEDYRL